MCAARTDTKVVVSPTFGFINNMPPHIPGLLVYTTHTHTRLYDRARFRRRHVISAIILSLYVYDTNRNVCFVVFFFFLKKIGTISW